MPDTTEHPPPPPADLDEYLAGLHDEPTADEAQQWEGVTSDDLATWAFRKRKGYAAELERLRGLAAAERAKIDAWEHDATAGLVGRLEWFDGQLEGYYRRLWLEQGDDLPQTYRVPGGELGRRKNPDALEVAAEAEALEWLMDNRTELVKLAPDKTAIKGATVALGAKPTKAQLLAAELPEKVLVVPGLADAKPGDRLPVVDRTTGETLPGLVWLVGAERVFVKPVES